MIDPMCSEKCGQPVDCATCGKSKAPIGRSIPLGAYMCDSDCEGYRKDPYPPHLWPREFRELSTENAREGKHGG